MQPVYVQANHPSLLLKLLLSSTLQCYQMQSNEGQLLSPRKLGGIHKRCWDFTLASLVCNSICLT